MGKSNNIVLTLSNLREAEEAVSRDKKYGPEQDLIKRVIQMHPANHNLDWIAMKVSVIDLTNSTQLSKYKSFLSLVDIADIILHTPNIDRRLEEGDWTLVEDIAKSTKDMGINLFSFASKYCFYHNYCLYEKDDYSIFDSVVSQHLHEYHTNKEPIGKTTPESWRISFDYNSYCEYIGHVLDDNCIFVPGRRRMFDHLVWYNNK